MGEPGAEGSDIKQMQKEGWYSSIIQMTLVSLCVCSLRHIYDSSLKHAYGSYLWWSFVVLLGSLFRVCSFHLTVRTQCWMGPFSASFVFETSPWIMYCVRDAAPPPHQKAIYYFASQLLRRAGPVFHLSVVSSFWRPAILHPVQPRACPDLEFLRRHPCSLSRA